MYADRYARPEGIKPGSLTIAIAINGAIFGALALSAPVMQRIAERKPLTISNVPIDPPPEPLAPELKAKPQQQAKAPPEHVDMSRSTITATTYYPITLDPPVLPPLVPGNGETLAVDPPAPSPILVGAALDPRYARYLQPPYPPGERRAETEGSATLRLVVGTDGRVKSAECTRADSDGFCRASINQALSKWRFTPAMRDGVPIESTVTKTVRFVLDS